LSHTLYVLGIGPLVGMTRSEYQAESIAMDCWI